MPVNSDSIWHRTYARTSPHRPVTLYRPPLPLLSPPNHSDIYGKNKSPSSMPFTSIDDEEYLRFEIVTHDGGVFSHAYSIENILHDDATVYCSSKAGNVNILLRFNDPHHTDTTCVLTSFIIKAPAYGFTAPCTEGLLFISHEPISEQDTAQYDDYTIEDYDELQDTVEDQESMLRPAAYFSLEAPNGYFSRTQLNHRSARYVLVKLLRSDGNSNNIDVQYIGFMGYTGARSFPNGPFR
ncbi:uncharacterized protein VTP21DRAFT_3158 [Calcarisporiella thermophila]|uniref:uncharacterized protein n=1 Tax=Calcarisporiella thermophila TaxID=911321 RepID=UPI00374459CB